MRAHRLLILSVAGLGVPLAAAAQTTTTTTFDVTLTVTDSCRIVSTTPIDFGTAGVINANLDATGSIGVECTSGTPYDIDLNAGQGAGATTTVRRMTGLTDTTATVNYAIYQDSGRTTIWGEGGGGGSGVAATGTGALQTFTTYGRVPPVQSVPPQAYQDTVTVSVIY